MQALPLWRLPVPQQGEVQHEQERRRDRREPHPSGRLPQSREQQPQEKRQWFKQQTHAVTSRRSVYRLPAFRGCLNVARL